jgi:hypothetical protein
MTDRRPMPISEVGLFAYATKGEALVVANRTVTETVVAEIIIMKGSNPATVPVAWIVLPREIIDVGVPAPAFRTKPDYSIESRENRARLLFLLKKLTVDRAEHSLEINNLICAIKDGLI